MISQPDFKHFQISSVTVDKIFAWESIGLSEESIITSTTPDNNFTQKLIYIYNSKVAVKSERIFSKQDEVSFTHRNVVTLFIAHEWDT